MTTTSTQPRPSFIALVARNVRAEFTKMRTVRSTMWTLGVMVVLVVGLGALITLAGVSQFDNLSPRAKADFSPVQTALGGLILAQLAIGVLGALVVTSEYGTGQIRATLSATPQRVTMLVAKALTFIAVAFVVGTAACFLAYAVSQPIAASKDLAVGLGEPNVLRAIFGAGAYLAGIGAVALGVGFIVRRTAAAITIVVGILLVLPVLAAFIPGTAGATINKYLPSAVGGAMFTLNERVNTNTLSPGMGFLIFTLYAVGVLAIGAVILVRRDA